MFMSRDIYNDGNYTIVRKYGYVSENVFEVIEDKYDGEEIIYRAKIIGRKGNDCVRCTD